MGVASRRFRVTVLHMFCLLQFLSIPIDCIDAATASLSAMARSAEPPRQARLIRISRKEAADVRQLLWRFVEAAIVVGDAERAYREFLVGPDPNEVEKRYANWDGFRGTTLQDLSLDIRARAFAVVWRHEYAAVTLALGLAADPSMYDSRLEEARRIVDQEFAAVRAKREISEERFYDTLDFQHDAPLVLIQKLELMETLVNDLSLALSSRYRHEKLHMNARQLVASSTIEKYSVKGESVYVANLSPELSITCSARLGPLRIVGFSDDY